MFEKRTIFIIPGFKHRPTQKAYKNIVHVLDHDGFTPIPVSLLWNRRTVSENTAAFLEEYRKVNVKRKYILGFSFGAMVALLASTQVPVNGLILCSLSPYFREDIKLKRFSSRIKNLRYQDFSKLDCSALTQQIKAKRILFLYGVRETKPLIKRVVEAFEQTSSAHKYLIPIKETDHDIGDRRYQQVIHRVTKSLLTYE